MKNYLALLFILIVSLQAKAFDTCSSLEIDLNVKRVHGCGTIKNSYDLDVRIQRIVTVLDGGVPYSIADGNFESLSPDDEFDLPWQVFFKDGSRHLYWYVVQAVDGSRWGDRPTMCAHSDLTSDKKDERFTLPEWDALMSSAPWGLDDYWDNWVPGGLDGFCAGATNDALTPIKMTDLNVELQRSNRTFKPKASGNRAQDKANKLSDDIEGYTTRIGRYVSNIIDKLKALKQMSLKIIDEWTTAIEPYLSMDVLAIDPSTMGNLIPQWFVDLIEKLQSDQKEVDAKLAKIDLRQIEENSATDVNLDSYEQGLGEQFDGELIDDDLADDLVSQEVFAEIKRRETYWLNLFAELATSDRALFNDHVALWEQDSLDFGEIAASYEIERPGFISAFELSQITISAQIEAHIDENGFFRDLQVSDKLSSRIMPLLDKKNPA